MQLNFMAIPTSLFFCAHIVLDMQSYQIAPCVFAIFIEIFIHVLHSRMPTD